MFKSSYSFIGHVSIKIQFWMPSDNDNTVQLSLCFSILCAAMSCVMGRGHGRSVTGYLSSSPLFAEGKKTSCLLVQFTYYIRYSKQR